MLSHDYTLSGKKEFERVKEDGEVIQSESFGVSFIKKEDSEFSKFGFIVSNKISKDSVGRNRIKRAMKEAIRQSFGEVGRGLDAVFFAKPYATRRSTEEIMGEVKVVVRKMAG